MKMLSLVEKVDLYVLDLLRELQQWNSAKKNPEEVNSHQGLSSCQTLILNLVQKAICESVIEIFKDPKGLDESTCLLVRSALKLISHISKNYPLTLVEPILPPFGLKGLILEQDKILTLQKIPKENPYKLASFPLGSWILTQIASLWAFPEFKDLNEIIARTFSEILKGMYYASITSSNKDKKMGFEFVLCSIINSLKIITEEGPKLPTIQSSFDIFRVKIHESAHLVTFIPLYEAAIQIGCKKQLESGFNCGFVCICHLDGAYMFINNALSALCHLLSDDVLLELKSQYILEQIVSRELELLFLRPLSQTKMQIYCRNLLNIFTTLSRNRRFMGIVYDPMSVFLVLKVLLIAIEKDILNEALEREFQSFFEVFETGMCISDYVNMGLSFIISPEIFTSIKSKGLKITLLKIYTLVLKELGPLYKVVKDIELVWIESELDVRPVVLDCFLSIMSFEDKKLRTKAEIDKSSFEPSLREKISPSRKIFSEILSEYATNKTSDQSSFLRFFIELCPYITDFGGDNLKIVLSIILSSTELIENWIKWAVTLPKEKRIIPTGVKLAIETITFTLYLIPDIGHIEIQREILRTALWSFCIILFINLDTTKFTFQELSKESFLETEFDIFISSVPLKAVPFHVELRSDILPLFINSICNIYEKVPFMVSARFQENVIFLFNYYILNTVNSSQPPNYGSFISIFRCVLEIISENPILMEKFFSVFTNFDIKHTNMDLLSIIIKGFGLVPCIVNKCYDCSGSQKTKVDKNIARSSFLHSQLKAWINLLDVNGFLKQLTAEVGTLLRKNLVHGYITQSNGTEFLDFCLESISTFEIDSFDSYILFVADYINIDYATQNTNYDERILSENEYFFLFRPQEYVLDWILKRDQFKYAFLELLEIIGRFEFSNEFVLLKVFQFIIDKTLSDDALVKYSALDNIRKICIAHKNDHIKIAALLTPLMNSMSTTTMHSIVSDQEILRSLSSSFEITTLELAEIIFTLTLPKLVLYKDVKTIESLAIIGNMNIPTLLISNLSVIFVEVFMQDPHETDECIEFIMKNTGIKELDVLLESCLLMLVTYLCINVGCYAQKQKVSASNGLNFLQKKLSDLKHEKTFDSGLSEFMSYYFTGILSYVSTSILSKNSNKICISECRKMMRSIGELINIIGPRIATFSPQIITSIKRALEVDHVFDIGLECLYLFVSVIPGDKLSENLQEICSILCASYKLVYKEKFSSIIQHILVKRNSEISHIISSIFIFKNHELFQPFAHLFAQEKSQTHSIDEIPLLIKSLRTSNTASVIESSLICLKDTLNKNLTKIIKAFEDNISSTIVYQIYIIVWTVLHVCRKFQQDYSNIGILCCDCLGMVGAIDFMRIPEIYTLSEITSEINSLKDAIEKPVFSLNSHTSSIKFSFYLIKNILGPAYIGADNTKHQLYFAYNIQELLSFCGFKKYIIDDLKSQSEGIQDNSIVNKQRRETNDSIYMYSPLTQNSSLLEQLWLSLDKFLAEKLAPMVNTNFYISPTSTKANTDMPWFTQSETYREWLVNWTISLIDNTSSPYAINIFSILKETIRVVSLESIPTLILYIIFDILAFGSKAFKNSLKKEIFTVLEEVSSKSKFACSESGICEKDKLACNVIFYLVTHLGIWAQNFRREHFKKIQRDSNSGQRSAASTKSLKYAYLQKISSFLESIDLISLGEAALACKGYARSIMYYETYLRREVKANNFHKKAFSRLQKIYYIIKEEDYVQGLGMKIANLTLEHEILMFENNKDWAAAQIGYENLLSQDKSNFSLHEGMMKCLRSAGQFRTLIKYAKGLSHEFSKNKWDINNFIIESAWRLGEWDDIQDILVVQTPKNFEVKVAQVLFNFSRKGTCKVDEIRKQIQDIKISIANDICFIKDEFCSPTTATYEALIRLHMTHDLQSVVLRNRDDFNFETFRDITLLLERRSRISVKSFHLKEPILYLNNVLHRLSRYKLLENVQNSENIKELNLMQGLQWLNIAKNARKSGCYQNSLSNVFNALSISSPVAYVERARLMYIQGKKCDAMHILEKYLENFKDEKIPAYRYGIRDPKKTVNVKARLYLTKWAEETNSKHSCEIISEYESIIKDANKWERGLLYLGQYYNKMYQGYFSKYINTPMAQKKDDHLLKLAILICKQYSKILTLGDKYYYQTMPRILTLWLNHGSIISCSPSESQSEAKTEAHFKELNEIVIKMEQQLPAYMFLKAISQLTSRIGHTNSKVLDILFSIIAKVLVLYPEKAFWNIIAVYNSSNKTRAERMKRVLNCVKNYKDLEEGRRIELIEIMTQTIMVSDLFIKLCNLGVKPTEVTIDLVKSLPELSRMTALKLILPLQSSIFSDLTLYKSNLENTTSLEFSLPRIQKIFNKAKVINSLQKPKTLKILGSDGNEYTFLFKPKDDLRKDCRMMEFNSMIKGLLKRSPESQRRKLGITTYAATPLNDECGIIEWIPNTIPFRKILMDGYKSRGIYTSQTQIKEIMNLKNSNPMEIFTKILARFPPIFYEWFLESFPEPERWLLNRYQYSSTTAVMSIVGYVVGLGDRHGENILLDTQTGSIIHVDFNCLFEKGKTFEKPEVVPFRLTHNMVDAFGSSGVEGVFRRCCEATLKVLRDNREALLSVLETFVYDPLCEWNRKRKPRREYRNKRPESPLFTKITPDTMRSSSMLINIPGEPPNEYAVATLDLIDRKLKGQTDISTSIGSTLGISGHVNYLIEQSTSLKNLSEMYIGWGAYL